jgi:hypothetical protein
VAGVTSRWARSRDGSTRTNADRIARSDQDSRGRFTCRRSTPTSWRNASNSAVTTASLRANAASHPNNPTVSKYSSFRHTGDDHAQVGREANTQVRATTAFCRGTRSTHDKSPGDLVFPPDHRGSRRPSGRQDLNLRSLDPQSCTPSRWPAETGLQLTLRPVTPRCGPLSDVVSSGLAPDSLQDPGLAAL